MKKILYLIFSLCVFFSCSDDDPAPQPGTLTLDETELSFIQIGETKNVKITTNATTIEATVDEEDWCSVDRTNDILKITTKYNNTTKTRNAIVTVKADEQTATIAISQEGIETNFGGDIKLTVSAGTASSEETASEKQEFAKSFDGDLETFWHSKWSEANTFPVTATYELKDADQLDYIMYHPRSSGSNGLFGEIEIQVSTEANTTFTKVMDYNCEMKTTASKITLSSPISKPKAVRFLIKSGNGGFASCGEMEFYKTGTAGGITTAKAIPLGGNSYVTAGTGSISDAGFVGWSSNETVYSTYFRVNESGDLKLYLKYRPDGDNNVIEATCKSQKFTVTLPKPKVQSDTIIYLGAVEKCEAGYVQLDFKGVTLNGSVYAYATDLLVDGTATTSMNYVGNFSYYWGRRGPSVHMGYTIPSDITAEWLYNEVTVPEGQDALGSYFMANGFSEGYFGMQVNSSTERRILFSVWSPYQTDDPSQIPEEDQVKLIKKGENVRTGEFGNEGSGGQSYYIYNWKGGTTYKFLNRIRPIEDGYSEYTAYFFAPEVGEWKLIAQWKRPKIQTYYKGAHSFLENFNVNTGYIGRKASYNNQWVYTKEGEWVELTKGKFTVDATGRPGWRKDYRGGVDNSGFFLQNCGFFNDFVDPDTTFERTPTNNKPNINWSELE